jgi:ABC-type transport system involved in multi-copper enzyme maturation permease subunit
MKIYSNLILTVVWLIIGLSFAFFFPVEDDPFGVGTIAFSLVYFLIGIALSIKLILNLFQFKSKQAFGEISIFLISVIFIYISIPMLSEKGIVYRRDSAFNWNLPIYEEIVAKAQSDKETMANGNYHGIYYEVEVNPNVRVAFPLGGILDNWEAIIYDPSGEVLQAKGFTNGGKFTAPDKIKKIFGGDLVSCKAIYGNFYRCRFT